MYKAKNKINGNFYACKATRKKNLHNMDEFKNNLVILKELDHPNVLKIYDVYENDQWVFVIQELCEGGELFFYITQTKELSEEDAALIMRQAIGACQYCHKV